MKFLLSRVLCVLLLLTSSMVLAQSSSVEKLTQVLAKTMPNVKPSKITESPIKGLFEVVVGSQVVYMDINARYMIEGDLFDRKTKKNITEKAKSSIRLALVNKLGEKNMIVYQPKKTQHTITIVTDIDCPYCRRLHDEVPQYLKNNVKVRYIFMPLKGADDVEKTISVWCSSNKQKALDEAKSGKEIKQKTCDNPLQQHMAVAQALGVRGTPAILLDNGEMIPGYVPVDKLLVELKKM